MRRLTDVVVVVPARDEAALLPECLDHLARARRQLTRRFPRLRSRIVLVLDSCTDDSRAVLARRRDCGLEVVESIAGTAGGARAVGTSYALGGRRALDRIWLANTDADSQVPGDWLEVMVELAVAGAQLVLGTVRPGAELDFGTRSLWYARHRLVEEHPHVHGANFGIRADVFTALGGWPALTSGEDVALAASAVCAGATVRRTARIPVTTSARFVGRAPGGFASYLRELTA